MLKLNKNGIDVGDAVVIKDIDKDVYRRYASFLSAYLTEEFPYEGHTSDQDLANWRFGMKPDEGVVYYVKFIGLHENEFYTLCVIANNTNTFIVDVKNLRKAEGAVDEAEKKYLDSESRVNKLREKGYKMMDEYNSLREELTELEKEELELYRKFQDLCPHKERIIVGYHNGIPTYICKRCGKLFEEL